MWVAFAASSQYTLPAPARPGCRGEEEDGTTAEGAAARADDGRAGGLGADHAREQRTGRLCGARHGAAGGRRRRGVRRGGTGGGPAVGRRGGAAGRPLQSGGARGLTPGHGGGPARRYQAAEQGRILQEFHRQPDRERDGTATWSLGTLRRALRRAPDGLPHVSTWAILQTLYEAGYSWQASRTWCHTGVARRKRKDGTVVRTVDPDATANRGRWGGPTG